MNTLLKTMILLVVSIGYLAACAPKTTIPEKLIIRYYKKYRFESNKKVTFKNRDEVTEKKAKGLSLYYKTFYDGEKRIVKIEIYKKGKISKRQVFNPVLGTRERLENFKNGKLFNYYSYVYDEKEKKLLLKQEVFSSKNKLQKVLKFGFGQLEVVDYYNSKGYLVKTEQYAGKEIDVTKYYDDKGNVSHEKGRYDNGRKTYSTRYFYDKSNNLIKVQQKLNGRLSETHYYSAKGKLVKTEKYNKSGKKVKTIRYDKKKAK
ncbi:MAG: hypothetical protein OEZ36_08285 [Spirochaetota bacterium]|nr:hypothetical protein [Spirochaetota bacterium]